MFLAEIFLSGFLISLAGSLPLGSLNVAAMHIAAHEGVRKSLLFALGVVLTEIIYLRITFAGIHWVAAHRSLFLTLQWLTVIFLFALAVGSFRAAQRRSAGKNRMIQNNMPRLVLGMVMSAVNPMQFPFWAGWALVLLNAHRLSAGATGYNVFTAGAGIGTFTAMLVFIFFGRRFSGIMLARQRTVQWGMGVLFLLLAVYQLLTVVKLK
jgi:threonine/homoserine/homoserine lactone efflux protein